MRNRDLPRFLQRCDLPRLLRREARVWVVAVSFGVLLLETGEDLEIGAVFFHRLEGGPHFIILHSATGTPMFKVYTVGDVEISHAQRRAAGGGADRPSFGCGRHEWVERFESGQCKCGSESS